MAVGAIVLLVAMIDDLVRVVRGKAVQVAAGDEAKRLE
jgi:hypothetical protein